MQKQEILNAVLGYPSLKNKEALYHCPKCNHHKKKLSVNLSKGVFKCWACEFSGKNLGFLIKRYGTYDQYMSWAACSSSYRDKFLESQPTPRQVVQLPKEFATLCLKEPRSIHRPALNYLASRGISREDILRWKMGFCYQGKYRGRIIVPSFDSKGEVNYFIARTYTGSNIKYLNPSASKDIVFNELMVDWSNPVVLVEGVFDAVKVYNSIPILGSTLNTESELFQKLIRTRRPVYVALDNDAQKKEERIIKNLLLHGVEVHKMEVPKNHDLGDLTKEECAQIKQKANFVENVDYLLYQKILGGI